MCSILGKLYLKITMGWFLKQKNQHFYKMLIFCAPEEIRTLTPLQAPPPQGGVSTNSTTEANA